MAASLCILLALAGASPAESPPFALKDGDRVVFLGGGLVERDWPRGDLETALTARFAGRDRVFHPIPPTPVSAPPAVRRGTFPCSCAGQAAPARP